MIVIKSLEDKVSIVNCFDTCSELKQFIDEYMAECDLYCETQADKFRAFQEMYGRISFN